MKIIAAVKTVHNYQRSIVTLLSALRLIYSQWTEDAQTSDVKPADSSYEADGFLQFLYFEILTVWK